MQLIISAQCTEAEGVRWHLRHFCCFECEGPLGGQRYVMRRGRPYCARCHRARHAEFCDACGDPIGESAPEEPLKMALFCSKNG